MLLPTLSLPDALCATLLLAVLLLWASILILRSRGGLLPPGPPSLPVVGYLPFLDPKFPYKTLSELADKYGPVYGVRLGGVYAVVLADAALVRKAFFQESFNGRSSLLLTHQLLGGRGLIWSQGNTWRQQRKMAVDFLGSHTKPRRSFSDRLKDVVDEEVAEFLQDLDARGQLGPVDVGDRLKVPLSNIICQIVFGRRFPEDDPWGKRQLYLTEQGVRYAAVAGVLNFLPFLRWLPRFRRIYNFMRSGIRETHEVYRKLIGEHKAEEGIQDFIDHYLSQMGSGGGEGWMSVPDLCAILGDFFGAGTDTVKTTLSWLFLFVARNPDVQRRLQEEIDSQVPRTRHPVPEDMPHLPYTEATIMEGQRLGNVVPLGAPHATMEKTSLAGFSIPANAMIIPLLWKIHMDPSTWHDPWRFDPTRFLSEKGEVQKPDYFLPFSTGKRRCIGENVARRSIFVFLTSVLQRYIVALEDEGVLEHSPEYGFTLSPPAYRVVLKERSLSD